MKVFKLIKEGIRYRVSDKVYDSGAPEINTISDSCPWVQDTRYEGYPTALTSCGVGNVANNLVDDGDPCPWCGKLKFITGQYQELIDHWDRSRLPEETGE